MKASSFFKNLGKILGVGILVGIFALIFGIYWQLGHGESADYEAVKEAIVQYGNDMNEMREYLYLPANNYDFFKADVSENTDGLAPQEDTELQKGVEMFASELAKKQNLLKNQEQAKSRLETLVKDPDFTAGLEALELTAAPDIEADEDYARIKIFNGQEALAQLLLSLEDENYSLQSIVGVEVIKGSSPEAIVGFLEEKKDPIIEKKALLNAQKEAMANLWKEGEITEVLSKNLLSANPDPVENTGGFEYYVTDLNGSPLLTINLDRETGRFVMESVGYKDVQEIKGPLFEKLNQLSGETKEVKAIKAKKESLEKYLNSSEFKSEMKAGGIEVSEAKIDGENMFYELIQTEGEQKLGTILFNNSTGDIRFIDAADGLESSLEDILSGSKKKP